MEQLQIDEDLNRYVEETLPSQDEPETEALTEIQPLDVEAFVKAIGEEPVAHTTTLTLDTFTETKKEEGPSGPGPNMETNKTEHESDCTQIGKCDCEEKASAKGKLLKL